MLLVLINLLVIPSGFSNNKKANRYFELFKYSKAIPLYRKNTESTNEKIRKEATFRLADCFRLTNNVIETRSWYARCIEFSNPEPIHYFYLGQALRSLEEYDEAEHAFQKYAKLKPDDRRGEVFAGYCREVKKMMNLPVHVEIKNASALNTKYSDFCPVPFKTGIVLTSDRKTNLNSTNVYEWTNYGFLDLYFSDPIYYQDFWTQMSDPVKMPPVYNQTYHDGPVSFTGDEKMVFLTRTLMGRGKKDGKLTRTNTMHIFYGNISNLKKAVLIPFPFNSENYSVGHPSVSSDGSRLVFSSDMPGGNGGSDLYMSELKEGKWSEPVNLGVEINSFLNEAFPYWSNDSTLYFSSEGHPGYGGLDIFISKLVDGKWSAPVNMLMPINSSYDDFGIVLQKNKSDGFFSSNRPEGLGADDIYTFRNYSRKEEPTREKLVELPSTLPEVKPASPLVNGFVKDKTSQLPVYGAMVFLLNSKSNEVSVMETDSTGLFSFRCEKGVLQVVKVMMNGYFGDCLNYRILQEDTLPVTKLPRDLLLSKYDIDMIFKMDNIYYDLNQFTVRTDARPALDDLVMLMKQYPITVELGSHTDSRATSKYNEALSQRRADAAVAYIISNGINPSRIKGRGYGESQLLNQCTDGASCTEAEHQVNRRTEFRITGIDKVESEKKNADLTVFRPGDKLPVQLFDSAFFKECMK